MDYFVHLHDIKIFEAKGIANIDVRDDIYYLYNENNEILLTVPKEKVKAIVSTDIRESK